VSSIWPPHCELISREQGVKNLIPGQVVFAVVAEASTNEPSRLATAAIGLAIPADQNHHGYISEHHAFGQRKEPAGDYAEDLAASMLATVLGVPFDPDVAWDERKEQWRVSGEIVDSMNMSCSAEAQDDGRWATVVSAVVFCG
jgi:arginine decarboxylase